MTYNSLKIPVVLFFEILETNNYSLLSTEDLPKKELESIWIKLYDEFSEKNEEKENNNYLNLEKNITRLTLKYKAINVLVDCLMIDYDDENANFLRREGYKVTEENYLEDLERVREESDHILVRVNNFKNQLPEIDETKKFDIYDTLAQYSSILGFDLDENVSVNKFFALKKSVKNKIKQLEANE